MIVGLILLGSAIGAGSALGALVLGHSIWMALLIYSGIGVLSVLAGAAVVALRTAAQDRDTPLEPYSLAPPQRG